MRLAMARVEACLACMEVEYGLWQPIEFKQVRAGLAVRTRSPRNGEVLGQGVAHRLIECKDHLRWVDSEGNLLARSDFECVEVRA